MIENSKLIENVFLLFLHSTDGGSQSIVSIQFIRPLDVDSQTLFTFFDDGCILAMANLPIAQICATAKSQPQLLTNMMQKMTMQKAALPLSRSRSADDRSSVAHLVKATLFYSSFEKAPSSSVATVEEGPNSQTMELAVASLDSEGKFSLVKIGNVGALSSPHIRDAVCLDDWADCVDFRLISTNPEQPAAAGTTTMYALLVHRNETISVSSASLPSTALAHSKLGAGVQMGSQQPIGVAAPYKIDLLAATKASSVHTGMTGADGFVILAALSRTRSDHSRGQTAMQQPHAAYVFAVCIRSDLCKVLPLGHGPLMSSPSAGCTAGETVQQSRGGLELGATLCTLPDNDHYAAELELSQCLLVQAPISPVSSAGSSDVDHAVHITALQFTDEMCQFAASLASDAFMSASTQPSTPDQNHMPQDLQSISTVVMKQWFKCQKRLVASDDEEAASVYDQFLQGLSTLPLNCTEILRILYLLLDLPHLPKQFVTKALQAAEVTI